MNGCNDEERTMNLERIIMKGMEASSFKLVRFIPCSLVSSSIGSSSQTEQKISQSGQKFHEHDIEVRERAVYGTEHV